MTRPLAPVRTANAYGNDDGEEGVVKLIPPESEARDVDAYIARAPKAVQGKLKEVRAAMRQAAPGASETTSYFEVPGYYYPGYDYNGMFAWFGLQKSHLSIMVRPPTIQMHERELEGYDTTKSAVHLSLDGKTPQALIKKLVRTSVEIMKAKPKAAAKPRRHT